MWFCVFFDFRFIFVIIKYSPVLFNNFASGAADIGDQLVFRCFRPVFKLSGEINLITLKTCKNCTNKFNLQNYEHKI